MPKLQFKKLANDGTGKYPLLVGHKIKELINYYRVPSLFIFQKELQEYIKQVPQKNAYSLENAYRLKVEKGICQIWKHAMGSDKDPVLVYEIWEEVDNV